jgi:nucleoside triphosphate pyrophosphatase
MALWIASKPLILASKSEVRRKILAGAGVPVEARAAPIDERAVEARSHVHEAAEVARVLAGAKAHTVAAEMPGRMVLGADQTLTLDGARFSKPADRAGARAQLLALRGQTHRLHSAVTLVRDGAVLFEHSDAAELTMRAFSDGFLESYLDTTGPAAYASVGGYQIESVGIHLFEKIDGDYFTILGLPLLPLLGYLRGSGVIAD